MDIRRGIRRVSLLCGLFAFLVILILYFVQGRNRFVADFVPLLTRKRISLDQYYNMMTSETLADLLHGALVAVPTFFATWLAPYWLFVLGRTIARWVVRGFQDRRAKPDDRP